MYIRRSDLADLTYFLEIARHRNFRRAGIELGISASALSHALKGLEERLGVRLLNRTSRSVTLTVAGEELQAAIAEHFDRIGQAVDALNRHRDGARGRVRVNVPTEAANHLVSPVLATFVERYPDVEIEISVSNRMIDVIESGYDAGIRYGGTVPEDMVAQRLSADIKWMVVGAPSYLQRFGVPEHPEDLRAHRCIQIRIGDDRIYRWEFERGEEELNVAVPGALIVDQGQVGLMAARTGAGLIYGPDFVFRAAISAGELEPVLDAWAPKGPGFHIYYSGRRQVPTALRLFIELVREMRPLGL